MVRTDVGGADRWGAGIIFARTAERFYVVTAFHVVHPEGQVVRSISVAFYNAPNRWLHPTVDRDDEKRDFTVLTIADRIASAAAIEFDLLAADDLGKVELLSRGYPLGQPGGEVWAMTGPEYLTGIDPTEITFTVERYSRGHSGGALLDTDGNVLGMLLRDKTDFGKAVRSDVLVRWLNSLGYPVALRAHRSAYVARDESLAVADPRRIRFYRTFLATISGDRQYLGDVSATDPGHIYSVTSDERGRITKVVVLRDGQTLRELRYRYTGDSLRPEFEDSMAGERRLSSVSIGRNAQGYRIREDFLRQDGSQSGYRVYRYGDHEVEITDYSPGQDRPTKTVRDFWPSGLMKSERYYERDGSYYETTVDPNTGREVLRAKITGWNISVIYRPTYNADGDLVREDQYDEKNVWFGYNDYAKGLLVLKHYKFRNDFTRDVIISYDVSRRAREAKFLINGKHICTFHAEYDSSGRFLRTIAVSPSGELWAEYPNAWVNEVYKEGQALDGRVTILHRKGSWW
ncbi:MAG TPA: serine protease [Candidatus Limnocylindrales bacterium]|nr:serine protease [Candidatus Limnocylindrales bacterium]